MFPYSTLNWMGLNLKVSVFLKAKALNFKHLLLVGKNTEFLNYIAGSSAAS